MATIAVALVLSITIAFVLLAGDSSGPGERGAESSATSGNRDLTSQGAGCLG